MRKIFIFTMMTLAFAGSVFISCSSDNNDSPKTATVQSDTIKNIYAEKSYVKFNFAQKDTVPSSSNDWDIAFNSTTIIVNGGSATAPFARTGNGGLYKTTGLLSDIASVDVTKFAFDTDGALALTTGSGNGWYTYDMTAHTILPTAGVVLVIRTHDGKYAKMVIDSYYKDAPTTVTDVYSYGYYTFHYVYQPNEGVTIFEN